MLFVQPRLSAKSGQHETFHVVLAGDCHADYHNGGDKTGWRPIFAGGWRVGDKSSYNTRGPAAQVHEKTPRIGIASNGPHRSRQVHGGGAEYRARAVTRRPAG